MDEKNIMLVMLVLILENILSGCKIGISLRLFPARPSSAPSTPPQSVSPPWPSHDLVPRLSSRCSPHGKALSVFTNSPSLQFSVLYMTEDDEYLREELSLDVTVEVILTLTMVIPTLRMLLLIKPFPLLVLLLRDSFSRFRLYYYLRLIIYHYHFILNS